ncbi:MAG: hypothetical protein KDB14_29645, partial [Planctomycetales bacterium]|nr:hypothetical protein [Planctomycetales bacterium]
MCTVWEIRFRYLAALAVLLVTITGCGGAADPDTTEVASSYLCSGAKLSASPAAPADPGMQVTLTASNTACAAGETPEFKFSYQRDGVAPWTVVQDYSASASANWDTTGLPSGRYNLIVYVRAAGSGASFQSASRATYFIKNVCTAASLSTAPPGPQPAGAVVSLDATASCTAAASAEFKYVYRLIGTSGYTLISNYTANANVQWDTTGLSSGMYDLIVYARVNGNLSNWESVAHASYLLGATCGSVALSTSPPSPQPVGTSVTLTGSASCASGTTPEYRFLYRQAGTSTYTELQPFSTSNTANWDTTALSSGMWELAVQARVQGSSGAESAATAGYYLGTDTQLTAGSSHMCARIGGNVKCFGRNLLGTPTGQYSTDRGVEASDMGDALPPVSLGTGQTAIAVAHGAYHACAILTGGSVKCWGSNGGGQLGLGDTEDRSAGAGELGDTLPTVDLGAGRTAKSITAGGNFTCAILDNGSVKCWGSNNLGQLGLGDTNNRGDDAGEMGDSLPAVDLGAGRTAVQIAAGASHSCAILDDSTTKCWGYNVYGSLGLGDSARRGDDPGEMGDALPAVDLGAGRHAVALSLGANLSCARLDNAAVKCWGHNGWGQLGQGDVSARGDGPGEMGDALAPVDLGAGHTALAMAAGGQHVCAILETGAVKCWGYNADGQLGVGDTNDRGDQSGEMGNGLPTVSLGTGHTAVRLVATYLNSCAELDDGSMKCWGANWSGMLGIGPSDNRGDEALDMGDNLPSFDFGGGKTAQSLGSGFGYHFGCALLNDASIKCWGSNSYGQLGIDRSGNTGDESEDMGSQLQNVDLGTGASVQQVAGGDSHTCALLAGGIVKCWGSGRYGTLGQGDTMRRSGRSVTMGDNLPAVSLGTAATAISAGLEHTCAILSTGSVKCWGRNAYGQLGIGDTSDRGDDPGEMGPSLPTVDLGGHTAMSVSAGYRHTCALLDDSSVRCWGWNLYGQLGLGDQGTRGDQAGEMGAALPAVDLGTGRTAVAVYAGVINSCAILDTGVVKCWGFNGSGQLGLGDTLTRGWKVGQMGDALPALD